MPGDERTEAATPRKRQDLRKRGQVCRSHDLSSVVVFIGILLCIRWLGGESMGHVLGFMRSTFGSHADASFSPQILAATAREMAWVLLRAVGPFVVTGLVLGIAVSTLQTGFLITARPLLPDLTRLNPLAGLKRVLSGRGCVELLKSIGKLAIVSWISYSTIAGGYPSLLRSSRLALITMVGVVGDLLFRLTLRIALFLLVLAALDYAYQRWSFERSIRMTKQEVKEELRTHEGDPRVKSRIRARMRQLARRRMMADVPKADVVLTNPTHYAVALRYNAEEMTAPQVVAKGADLVAQRIRQIAEEHGVPIVQNPPLTRRLFRVLEIGQEIPAEFYAAVAEVLAFVYQIDARRRGSYGRQQQVPTH